MATELVCRVWQLVQVPMSAVGIRLADAVALLAAADHRRCPFELREGMWRTFGPTGLIGFGEIHLLWGETLFAVNRSP